MSTFMERAMELAEQAAGKVSPNPAVGAVVVKNGVIVGEGFTQPPGGPHAEVIALSQAGEQAQGADIYVSLEPCSTYGKTPPCTDAIIAAGIKTVHMAVIDANPAHNGRAIAEFARAGIEVYTGEMQERAAELNEAFFKWVKTRLPFVTAKYAMTLDGKIATTTGDSRWISSPEARESVHRLRNIVDAIMVGVNTAIADDPELTARPPFVAERRLPRRIIVDSHGRLPLSSKVLQGEEAHATIVAVTAGAPLEFREAIAASGAEVLVVGEHANGVDLAELMIRLGAREITSILAEGGSGLLGSLFDARLVDKVIAFIAPILVGGREAVTPVAGTGVERISGAIQLDPVRVERRGRDVMISGYPKWG